MTKMTETYTIHETPEVVSVSEFRSRISHLERLVHCDFQACVSDAERARWATIARRVGSELIATTCKRATAEDWTRREKVIDRSAARLYSLRGDAA